MKTRHVVKSVLHKGKDDSSWMSKVELDKQCLRRKPNRPCAFPSVTNGQTVHRTPPTFRALAIIYKARFSIERHPKAKREKPFAAWVNQRTTSRLAQWFSGNSGSRPYELVRRGLHPSGYSQTRAHWTEQGGLMQEKNKGGFLT
jgi:hypothetical protein